MVLPGPPGLHNYVIIDYITNTELFNIELLYDCVSFVKDRSVSPALTEAKEYDIF